MAASLGRLARLYITVIAVGLVSICFDWPEYLVPWLLPTIFPTDIEMVGCEQSQERQGGSTFVIDMPLGGNMPLSDILGDAANNNAVAEEDNQQVWPYVPAEWGPTPPELHEAVKEVKYFSDTLYMTLSPRPLPTDNLAMLSDMLLSLETRGDITGRVLLDSQALQQLRQVADCGEWPQSDEHNLVQRAKDLVKHLEKAKQDAWEASRTTPGPSPDFPIVPVKTLPCDGKEGGWRFLLSTEQDEEAQNVFMAVLTDRIDSAAFFREQPPRPMGWAPLEGSNAWDATNRAKIESGDLYGSKLWKPLWGDYSFLKTRGKMWGWENANEEERTEYRKYKVHGDAWQQKILEMRQR